MLDGLSLPRAIDAVLERFGDKASHLGVGHGGRPKDVRKNMKAHFQESVSVLAMASALLDQMRDDVSLFAMIGRSDWVDAAVGAANTWADRFEPTFGRQLRPVAVPLAMLH